MRAGRWIFYIYYLLFIYYWEVDFLYIYYLLFIYYWEVDEEGNIDSEAIWNQLFGGGVNTSYVYV